MGTSPCYNLSDYECSAYRVYACLAGPERLAVDYALGVIYTPAPYIPYQLYLTIFALLPEVDRAVRPDYLADWLGWQSIDLPDIGQVYYVSTPRLVAIWTAKIILLAYPDKYKGCREQQVYDLVKPSW